MKCSYCQQEVSLLPTKEGKPVAVNGMYHREVFDPERHIIHYGTCGDSKRAADIRINGLRCVRLRAEVEKVLGECLADPSEYSAGVATAIAWMTTEEVESPTQSPQKFYLKPETT